MQGAWQTTCQPSCRRGAPHSSRRTTEPSTAPVTCCREPVLPWALRERPSLRTLSTSCSRYESARLGSFLGVLFPLFCRLPCEKNKGCSQPHAPGMSQHAACACFKERKVKKKNKTPFAQEIMQLALQASPQNSLLDRALFAALAFCCYVLLHDSSSSVMSHRSS